MTVEQEVVCRKKTQLEANSFSNPRQPAVEFAGWATSREAAMRGEVAYSDKQIVELGLDQQDQTADLYAVWREREVLTSWSDFSISGQPALSSDSTAMLAWTAVESLTYAGDSKPFSVQTVSSGGYVSESEAFGKNEPADPDSTAAARRVVAKLALEPYGIASCYVEQGGYKPKYELFLEKPYRGLASFVSRAPVPSMANGASAVSSSSNWISRDKTAVVVVGDGWSARKGCTYFDDPQKQVDHVAKPGKTSSCGGWLDKLVGWKTSDGMFYEVGARDSNCVVSTEVQCIAGRALTCEPVYEIDPSDFLSTWYSDSKVKSFFGGKSSTSEYVCPVDGTYAVSGYVGTSLQNGKACTGTGDYPDSSEEVDAYGSFTVSLKPAGGVSRDVQTFPFRCAADYKGRTHNQAKAEGVGKSSFYWEFEANRGDALQFSSPKTTRLGKCTHVTVRAAASVFPVSRSLSAAISAGGADSAALEPMRLYTEAAAQANGAAQEIEAGSTLYAAQPSVSASKAQTYAGSGVVCAEASCQVAFPVAGSAKRGCVEVAGRAAYDGRDLHEPKILEVVLSLKSAGQTATAFKLASEDLDCAPSSYRCYFDIPEGYAGDAAVLVKWSKAVLRRNSTSKAWESCQSLDVSIASGSQAEA